MFTVEKLCVYLSTIKKTHAMTILRIKKLEFDMILAGTKKTEWRSPSKYNKRLLFVPREEDGKLVGNDQIKEIKLINGYSKNAPELTVKVKFIRMVRFTKDIHILEDNFRASEGQFAIEIKLGKITKS